MEQPARHWTVPWVAATAAASAVVVVLTYRAGLLPVYPFMLIVAGFAGAFLSVFATFGEHGWLRTHMYRAIVWLFAGNWMYWTARDGWSQWTIGALIVGTAAAVVVAPLAATPEAAKAGKPEPAPTPEPEPVDPRPKGVRVWEYVLREILKQPVTVTAVKAWDQPRDGQRVYVDLAPGMTAKDVDAVRDRIAARCKLPIGCDIRVLDGDHQGAVALDVMTRDCLADEVLIEEDWTPASINDEFTVATSPRGEPIDVCLRQQSMIVGGTVGSGKTTLLHRIMMHLARCPDALIWVVDLNGGGVAVPFIEPWARGEVDRPIVDWVADNEGEAALMLATALAIAKERKTSQEARRRKRAANTTVLPLDKDLPAIIILTDEGGEVRQSNNRLGQLATEGISRVAQIGRAEGVRAIMSVLRGTADLLDKGLRVNAALRICLRMMEETEYDHVLGMNAGRTRLIHKGSGYVVREQDSRPLFVRTVNVLLDAVDRCAAACAHLRPTMPDSGLRAAARVRAVNVLDGRQPEPEQLDLPPLRDAEEGRGYTDRWVRYAPKLAEMRGEEWVEPEPAPKPKPAPTSTAAPIVPPGSQLGNLLHAFGVVTPSGDREPATVGGGQAPRGGGMSDEEVRKAFDAITALPVYQPESEAGGTQGAKAACRDHVLQVLAEAPAPLAAKGIMDELVARQWEVNRTYLHGVLRELREAGVLAQTDGGAYYLTSRD